MMKQLLLILCFIISGFAYAQPPSKFFSTYGGSGYDVGYDVKQTLDKGYIITGSTSSFGKGNTDLYLLKLDSMGQKRFETSFGGYNNEIGKGVIQLQDSSYVMVGYTSSFGIGGYDVFLVNADKNGNLLWQKTIGGSDWDFAYGIEQTTDGGFIISGTTYSFGYGNADGYIIKTDGAGNVVWSKTYGGKNDDEFKSVTLTLDGGYALTGYTKSYNDSLGDAWVFKIDMNGDSLWSKYYGGNKEDFGNGVIQDLNSNVFVAGGTKSHSTAGNSETFIATFDPLTGVLGYNYIDPSTGSEYYNDVTQGLNGKIANCGITKNPVFGYDGIIDMYFSFYVYFNFFSKGSTMYEEFYAISKTKDKGFVTVGKTTGYSAVLEDIFLMKMDSAGNYGVSIVGIEENMKANGTLVIYPNPSSDVVHILIQSYFNYKELKYEIVDLRGQLIVSDKISQSNTSVETSKLASGLYFIRVYENNEILNCSKISIIKP
ncbi:MAG: T9SS type A sorting domain-containing protein [Bacteroidetes bacterium]|nr:T9SS type A sorting domain-containing protein [Bacteroidota bacterium]